MRRNDPQELVRIFTSHLSRAAPLEELLADLVELLRARMAVSTAEVWTGGDGRFRRAVAVPHTDAPRDPIHLADPRVVASATVRANTWIDRWIPELLDDREEQEVRVAPAASNGELFGLLVVARVDRDFNTREEAALGELGHSVGLALCNVRLDTALASTLDELRAQASELRRSRARIVAASDEARRRIERDLHDGAQQSLLALGLKTRAALDALAGEPDVEAAMTVLSELENDIDFVSAELRRMAHGIYPHALKSGGLAEALPTLARGGTTVRVDATRTRLPADVEAAVYFCCLEAVQNVTKHAGPDAQARVTVEVDRQTVGTVEFVVADDGWGFDPAQRPAGVGLTNIADRLGALGGRVRVKSTPGSGTVVTGSLPFGA